MKSIIKFLSIVFDLLQPPESMDRVSLHMVKFAVPEKVTEKKPALETYIPRDYLYFRVHEIEDQTWQYMAAVNPVETENKAVN